MNRYQTATLGNGCFWCTEAIFQRVNGIIEVRSGYCGGHVANPNYKLICSGITGHAECLQIVFDPTIISYDELLNIFFDTHDPTTLNRQGNDVGTQYRSVIFFHDDEQKAIASNLIKDLNQQHIFKNPIVTTLEPISTFYPAEDYHQNYYNLNERVPYCNLVIRPKLQKFLEKYLSAK